MEGASSFGQNVNLRRALEHADIEEMMGSIFLANSISGSEPF